jgi:hypothetical protein
MIYKTTVYRQSLRGERERLTKKIMKYKIPEIGAVIEDVNKEALVSYR